MLSDITENNI